MSDLTMTALQVSLRALASRQRAIADNVANIETPGYTAKRVDFESSLRSAMQAQAPGATTIGQSRSSDQANQYGNNVNLETETLDLTETNLRYQLSIEALNGKYRLLRDVIRGNS